ncbi:MAG TPA: 4,5-DOPA dioxygenase extradiol [Croceibacterium sp.]|nr:4,5-DOPA dioxygenase extradiol [Croceibacterium sp.]
MDAMPALFIGHGSPMNALEVNRYTSAWREIGRALPRPRGVLVVSAHWYFGATAVTAMPRPRTIHDFYGFPEELFAFEYPAPGLPELAGEVAEVAKPHWVGADRDQWGIDHGAWSVLAHLFPEADVPVVQLSINALRPIEYHLELGARLAELRRRGIAVLASGNVVHNLSRLKWNQPESGESWSHRFDGAVIEQMTGAPAEILKVAEHSDYGLAVPTPDHFIPLLYLAGLAAAGGELPQVVLTGHTLGSISMTSYGLGAVAPPASTASGAAGIPRDVPPDQTNI